MSKNKDDGTQYEWVVQKELDDSGIQYSREFVWAAVEKLEVTQHMGRNVVKIDGQQVEVEDDHIFVVDDKRVVEHATEVRLDFVIESDTGNSVAILDPKWSRDWEDPASRPTHDQVRQARAYRLLAEETSENVVSYVTPDGTSRTLTNRVKDEFADCIQLDGPQPIEVKMATLEKLRAEGDARTALLTQTEMEVRFSAGKLVEWGNQRERGEKLTHEDLPPRKLPAAETRLDLGTINAEPVAPPAIATRPAFEDPLEPPVIRSTTNVVSPTSPLKPGLGPR